MSTNSTGVQNNSKLKKKLQPSLNTVIHPTMPAS